MNNQIKSLIFGNEYLNPSQKKFILDLNLNVVKREKFQFFSN